MLVKPWRGPTCPRSCVGRSLLARRGRGLGGGRRGAGCGPRCRRYGWPDCRRRGCGPGPRRGALRRRVGDCAAAVAGKGLSGGAWVAGQQLFDQRNRLVVRRLENGVRTGLGLLRADTARTGLKREKGKGGKRGKRRVGKAAAEVNGSALRASRGVLQDATARVVLPPVHVHACQAVKGSLDRCGAQGKEGRG